MDAVLGGPALVRDDRLEGLIVLFGVDIKVVCLGVNCDNGNELIFMTSNESSSPILLATISGLLALRP